MREGKMEVVRTRCRLIASALMAWLGKLEVGIAEHVDPKSCPNARGV